MGEDRITRAAASRRQRNPPPYDGPLYRVVIGIELKAANLPEATNMIETLCAELVTGKRIDATDLWIRNIAIMDEPSRRYD